jgi:hypothetical protein
MFTLLSDEQRKDPIAIIKDYCWDTYVNDLNQFFHLFSLVIESDRFDKSTKDERSDLFYRFRILLELLEACNLLYEMLEDNTLTYTIKRSHREKED